MSTLAATHPTLLDFKATLDPQDRVTDFIDQLAQLNPIIQDMPMVEGNELTGYLTTVLTGIPEPTFRKLYGGVQPSKSTSVKVREGCGMLENFAEIDKALADLNGNSAAWRAREERIFVEGFSQKFSRYLAYGNEATEPEGFTGFAPRFNSRSALNGENIITSASPPDGSDNASMWLIGWSDTKVHGIYPKGSKAGLQISDKGEVTVENVDGAGGRMQAYRTHFRWDVGLCVRDWRYVSRVQVDAEDLVKDAATGPDLFDLIAQAEEMIPSLDACRPIWYANRTMRTWLRRQATNKIKNSTLTYEMLAGKPVMQINGIPVKRWDALTNTEAAVS